MYVQGILRIDLEEPTDDVFMKIGWMYHIIYTY